MTSVFSRRPRILSTSIAFLLTALPTFAATETIVPTSTGAWSTPANWADGTALATGGTITDTRLNVNGLLVYDFPDVTTIFDVSSPLGEARPFGIASGDNFDGILRVNAGTLTFTTEAGTGVNQGPFITAALGQTSNSTGLLHINGGNVIINGATSYLTLMTRGGATSTGTVTIDSGSLSVDRIDFAALGVAQGATGTVNLNGGTLNTRSLSSGNLTVTANVNLNGGTLATSGPALAGQDLIGANIDNAKLNGAVTFNTSLGDGRISVPLTGAGSLTKVGSGKLTISSATAYTGATLVNAGTLATNTSHTGTSGVTVADGAAFSVLRSTAGGTFVTPTLALGSTGSTSLTLDGGTFSLSTTNPIIRADNFSIGEGLALHLTGSALSTGVFPLIDYAGSIGGAGFGGITLSVLGTPRGSATLVDNAAATRIDVNIVNQAIKWIGNTNNVWDVDDSSTVEIEGTQNWRTETDLEATNYLQGAGGTDTVIFDDSASGSRTVELTGTLTPTSITVNNTTASGDYTFAGAGLLAGTGTLTKNGTGVLTLANTTANTISGLVAVNAGTLRLGDGVTPGVGTLGSALIAMNGGTLEINRPDEFALSNAITGTSGKITITWANLLMNNTATDFSGEIDIAESRNLRLGAMMTLDADISGAGNVVIEPTNHRIVTLGGDSDFTGTTTVKRDNHLRITSATALGSTAGQTIVEGGGGDAGSNGSGASLQLSGGITVVGEALAIRGSGGSAEGITAQRGALQSVSGDNTWTGPVTLGGTNTRIGVQDGASLTVSGTISDGGAGFNMIFRGGTTTSGMITLSGANNSWGETHVFGSTTRIIGDDVLPVTAPLLVGTNAVGTSTFDLNGYDQRVAGLGQVGGEDNVITNNGATDSVLTLDSTNSRTSNAAINDGESAKISLVKNGSYTQTLAGFSSYTGATTVNAGTLVVTGNISGSITTVTGGILGGSGVVGEVIVESGGTIAPGTNLGSMTSGSLTLNGGSNFALQIDTSAAFADYLLTSGDLTLSLTASPNLVLTDLGGNALLTPGTALPFLNYSGTWNGGLFAVNGTAIADEGSFTFGANEFVLDYNHQGSTVALVVVPEPGSALLLLGGTGALLGFRRRVRRATACV